MYREDYIKAMVVGLEAADTILPSHLCTHPMVPLLATLAVFKATLNRNSVAAKNKEQVIKVGDYLAKQLATMATLVDKNTPTVVALCDTIPHGEGVRQRGPSKTLLFDVIYRLVHRIPLTKLVELDKDVCLYLTMLIVA